MLTDVHAIGCFFHAHEQEHNYDEMLGSCSGVCLEVPAFLSYLNSTLTCQGIHANETISRQVT